MDESETYLTRYAHELQESFRFHWMPIRLHREYDAGSITGFDTAWESEDKDFMFQSCCCFNVANKDGVTNPVIDLVRRYITITGLYPCEKSDEWPDVKMPHNTYLMGTYYYDGPRRFNLKFLVDIYRVSFDSHFMCSITVASRTKAIANVMANAYLTYYNAGHK